MYNGNLIDYFPIGGHVKAPRPLQAAVLNEMDKVFRSGKKFILVEGPVGCGKSAIAVALSRAFQFSHLITPRKSLQDQYFEDFSDHVVLMKGRGSYPCTINAAPSQYNKIILDLKRGQVRAPSQHEPNCSTAPCRNSKDIYNSCVSAKGDCPYTVAMETAQKHSSVIHNLHSFIFQTNFANKFDKRDLMVIDEAHEIQGVIREFISKKVTINKVIEPKVMPQNNNIDEWCDFLLTPEYVPSETPADAFYKESDPNYVSVRDDYVIRVEAFRAQKIYYNDKFVVESRINKVGNREISTTLEFIPEKLGGAANEYLFSKGEHVVLMSGTIYGKEIFCNNLGLNPADVHYIRIPSTFPVENRPIIAKPEYQVDTSFAMWNENFDEMIEKIDKIMGIFGDAKGLIHAPSYDAAEQIASRLDGTRVITHGKHDTQEKLQMFYDSKQPLVFISPVCQQGVDFKGDRARFQILTRVPYLNTSGAFVNHKVKNDYPWYNYEALIIFGQQLGRVNRSEDDYGATFLLDSRFNKFITKNLSKIPKWVQAAIVWK